MTERVGRRLWTTGLIVVIGVYVWASHEYLTVLLAPFGDAFAHLTAIRRTLEVGPFPGDLFYASGATPPYYSLTHIGFAILSRLTGTPPHELWIAAPPWIAAVEVLVVYAFVLRLTGDHRVAVLAAALELLLRLPGPTWAALSLPRSIAIAPRYLCWYLYLRGRPARRIGWLLGAGLALGICFATHLYVGGLCAVGVLLLDLSLFGRRGLTPAPPLLVLATGLAVASPWLGSFVDAALHRPELTHPLFDHTSATAEIPVLGMRLQLMQPRELLTMLANPLWIPVGIGLLLCLRRAWRGETSVADRFALWGVAAAALCVATPVYALALRVFGVWTPRLAQVAPFSLLFGLGICGAIDELRRGTLPEAVRRGLQLAAAGVSVWLLIATAHEFLDPMAATGGYGRALRQSGPLSGWNLADELARTAPLPHTILSDPETSYVLAYLLGSRAVSIPPAHGSAFADHKSRQRAVRQFYRPGEPEHELISILDAYGVDTVAVVPASTWPDQGWSSILLERLRRSPSFVDTGCCGPVVFLRYRRSG